MLQSKPASGQFLIIGNVVRRLQFRSSRIAGANLLRSTKDGATWISQGELFTGRLQVNKTLLQSEKDHVFFC